jgi:hypothetical protein
LWRAAVRTEAEFVLHVSPACSARAHTTFVRREVAQVKPTASGDEHLEAVQPR